MSTSFPLFKTTSTKELPTTILTGAFLSSSGMGSDLRDFSIFPASTSLKKLIIALWFNKDSFGFFNKYLPSFDWKANPGNSVNPNDALACSAYSGIFKRTK